MKSSDLNWLNPRFGTFSEFHIAGIAEIFPDPGGAPPSMPWANTCDTAVKVKINSKSNELRINPPVYDMCCMYIS